MSKARDLADSAQEINILDGKSFLDEDNLASDSATGIASQQSIKAYVDGITTTNITSTGALNSGSITSGFGNIDNGSSTITTTGAITGGSFVIGSADINENDLESIDGITAGTVSASKAVVVNTNKDITGFRNITATGTISGSLSGAIASTTTATTQAESDDSTKVATTAYVTDKITTLIGGAPSTLNDLNELAAAINDDANYNSTLTTALGTKLPKAGGTLTGDVLYNDNVKAKFGAGSDLQIYHTGGASVIQDSGDGSLFLQGEGQIVLGSVGNAESYAVFNKDGAVQLRHNNVQKLATTSTGIAVTGSTAHTAGDITNTISGTYNLNGANGTAGSPAYATYSFKDDPNTGMYRGGADTLAFTTAGSERMRIDSSGNLGIGETSPLGKLHIKGSDTGATASAQGNSLVLEDLENGLSILSSTAGAGYINFGDSGDNNIGMIVYDHSANALKTHVNGSERMRIDSSGNLLVATTNADPSFGTTTGSSLQPSGQTHHSSSGSSLVLNRTASDGTIAQFRKGGTTVGSIGAVSGQVYMADTAAGLRFSGQGADDVSPCNASGADKDNAVDLGQTSNRFKDVHAVNYYGDGSNLTGVGGSTTLGAVGTYTVAANSTTNSASIASGATVAGSTLRTNYYSGTHKRPLKGEWGNSEDASFSQSGTWRNMTGATTGAQFNVYASSLWVRIS